MPFKVLHSKHEAQMAQLEKQILECCHKLKELKELRSEEKTQEQFINYAETETHLFWQFDMSEFPTENIQLDLIERCVKLYAHRKKHGQYLEVNRKFQLPKNAGNALTATMSVNGILTVQAPMKMITH